VKSAVGKPLIYWSIDTLDWKTRSKTATINSVMNNVRDGSIVLMHDIHYPTKEAALELIPKLKKKGYQIVTVSDLAKYRGYTMKAGTVYYSFQ
jgi:peptidoglycan/xylan/chitin deacetylase (PgdA/CDA1 family)